MLVVVEVQLFSVEDEGSQISSIIATKRSSRAEVLPGHKRREGQLRDLTSVSWPELSIFLTIDCFSSFCFAAEEVSRSQMISISCKVDCGRFLVLVCLREGRLLMDSLDRRQVISISGWISPGNTLFCFLGTALKGAFGFDFFRGLSSDSFSLDRSGDTNESLWYLDTLHRSARFMGLLYL